MGAKKKQGLKTSDDYIERRISPCFVQICLKINPRSLTTVPRKRQHKAQDIEEQIEDIQVETQG